MSFARRTAYSRRLMKTNDTIGLAAMSSPTEEPTAASMWHALAGSPITDEFLDWPADVFALTQGEK